MVSVASPYLPLYTLYIPPLYVSKECKYNDGQLYYRNNYCVCLMYRLRGAIR